jgi:hypothetical protein
VGGGERTDIESMIKGRFTSVEIRSRLRTVYIAGWAAFVISIASCWIVPWRLAFGPGGSYFTFGYLNDEYTYAQRIQPLLDGATASNPINGICDPGIHSQFFLEDACRAVLTITGINVITFMWVWRLLSPIVIASFMILLARECFPRSRRPWISVQRISASAAALPVLYCLYYAVMEPIPPFSWLNRIPTNVEYLLSAFLIWSYVGFLRNLTLRYGLQLAAGAVAMVYLRFYSAIPWGLAILVAFVYLACTRRTTFRVLSISVIVPAVGLAPWLFILLKNRANPVCAEMMGRYFGNCAYEIHRKWPIYISTAIALAYLSRVVTSRRLYLLSSATALLALPFVCGIPASIRDETLRSDRYGCFYLFAVIAAGMMVLSRFSEMRGRMGMQRALWSGIVVIVLSVLSSGVVGTINWQHNLFDYQPGELASIVEDRVYFRGYDWVREHTPSSALFLVDDGFNWSNAPADDKELHDLLLLFQCNNDLFQIIARRKRVYTDLMYGNALSNADMSALGTLQRGTFGYPVLKSSYVEALKRFQPGYIFWRKRTPVIVQTAPPAVPRGLGVTLKQMSEVVYSDDVCEIWKINYHAGGQ